MSSTISSKGQVTLPKAVRDALGLKSGDAVDFVVKDGQAVLRPVKVWTLEDLGGCLKRSGRKALLSKQEERAALVKAMQPHWDAKFGKKAR